MTDRLGVLRLPAFRRLWLAQVVSEVGDWMALVVTSTLLYQRHHSAFEAGLVFVVGLLPQVGIGQWLSTYADRYSRRTILLIADAVRAGAYLLLGLAAYHLPGAAVLAILFVAACCTEPFYAARSAAILDLVPAGRYEAAVWVDSLTQDLTQALGFAVGGIVVAVLTPTAGLFGNAATFAGSFLLVAGLPRVRAVPDDGPPRGAAGSIAAAVRFLVRHPTARTLIVAAVLSEGVATSTDAAVVPFVTDLGAGFRWLSGAVLGATAAITLTVTAAVVRDVDRTRAYRLVRALMVLPVPAVALLLTPYWWAQAAGLMFAALLSVPMVPAAMVVNPLLPVRLRATCRSVIVGFMVLVQALCVAATGALLDRLGAARTVAAAFVAVGVLGFALLRRGGDEPSDAG